MKNIFFVLLTLLVVLHTNSVVAQVQNNGMLHISDNASLYVGSGGFTFGTGSTTTTTRTPSYGKLTLNSGVTVSGAASGAGLFTDGFVGSKSGVYYVLPTGQTTTYAPIGVTNTAVTNGVEAAFYIAAPSTVGAGIDATIALLPSAGYWVVKGDNVTLTMIWNSSLSSLTNSTSDLTIAGYNTSTSKWEVVTSGTPTGSLSSGTLSSTSAVILANYSAFTLAKKEITCAELVASSGNTRTWNGSAWDALPTLADAAVLSGDYPSSAGSFVCNSLAVGTNSITLVNGQTIEVVNNITGSGTITMSSESSILQRNNSSTITPTIALTKSTRTGMRANDYIYWGSPLVSNAYSQLSSAQAYNNANITTSGDVGAFDSKYKYVSGDESAAGGWQNLTSIEKGVGFIMRIKNQAPFSSTANSNDHINLTFTGSSNNGTITVPIANITSSSTSSVNYNLLANPYPSAIDASKFLEYNTNLDGVVYIWKSQTSNSGLGQAYTVSDYIAFTRAGSTASSGIGTTPFNGNIASAQGFMVKAITTSGSGSVIFNNCMRISGNNDQFMRTSSPTPIDRFKLNFTGTNGVGNQILVAYMPEATLAYDRMYDAELNSVSVAKLYSTTQNDNRHLAINARPNFELSDVVALGVNNENSNSENFSIAISDKEGVFASSDVDVYLHDTLLNTYHNFSNGNFSFISNVTDLSNRYRVVYRNSALNTIDFESNNVVAFIKNQLLNINSNVPMSAVTIYDISGRLVSQINVNDKLSITNDFIFEEGIYIAKIKLINGAIATHKLVNKK